MCVHLDNGGGRVPLANGVATGHGCGWGGKLVGLLGPVGFGLLLLLFSVLGFFDLFDLFSNFFLKGLVLGFPLPRLHIRLFLPELSVLLEFQFCLGTHFSQLILQTQLQVYHCQ